MLPQIEGTSLPGPPWSGFSYDRILDYYDGPRLLLQKSLAGQLYLAWWSDSTESVERWIYLPLSESRVHEILTGQISAVDGMSNPEDGYLVVVDLDSADGSVIKAVLTDFTDVPEMARPHPDARLNLRVPEEVSGIPSRERAHLLDLKCKGVLSDPTGRVSAKTIGQVIGNLQRLVDALGQAKVGKVTSRGGIPAEILAATRLDAVSAYAGSFGVRLETHGDDNLFGESVVRDSLEGLFDLIGVGHDVSGLTAQLRDLKIRVAKSYTSFLSTIEASLSVATLNWSQPGAMDPRQVQITQEIARNTIEQMKVATSAIEGNLELSARFIAGNMRTLKFEIHALDPDERISGMIDEDAISDVEKTPLSSHCRVTLQPHFRVVETTGEESTDYTLLSIEPS